MLLLGEMIQVREYLDARGRSPFSKWFEQLDPQAAARVATTLHRMENGNLSSIKNLGSGILESRIVFGPGYRIYVGRDGDSLVILLGGGTKKRQNRDIEAARVRWRDYKSRKREE